MKKDKDCWVVVFILIAMLIYLFIYISIIDYRTKDVAHKVCHNETNVEKIELFNHCKNGAFCNNIEHEIQTMDYNIICEEGVNYDGQYYSVNYNETKICLIKTFKEVCSIQ